MKIGILGSGGVAQLLGQGFLAKGHQVMLGTRDANKLNDWQKNAQGDASVGSFAEAASFGDVVFLCILGNVYKEVLDLAGKGNLKGKIVVDVTNPLDHSKGAPLFTATLGHSLGEEIQRALPESKVVKAFNTVSAKIMINPHLKEGTATMLIAGNDTHAKAQISDLAKAFGWDIADAGGIEMAYWLEAFAMLWIYYGAKTNHWTHAFRLLRE